MDRATGGLALAAAALALASCGGSTTADARGSGEAAGNGGSVPGGAASGGGGLGGSALGGSAGGSGGAPPVTPRPIDGFGCPGSPSSPSESASACSGGSFECDAPPMDLHVVLERSDAMAAPFGGGSKWDFAREGLRLFARGVSSSETVAVHVFGKTAGADPELDCDVVSYATPDVVIDDPSAADAALAALDHLPPAGPTSSVPAVQGAKQHASLGVPGHAQTVVLITARPPSACNEDLASVFVEGTTRMYVIALGADLDVESLAEPAGTRPFVFTETDEPLELAQALRHLERGGGKRECADYFEVIPPPPGRTFDYERTLLQIDDTTYPLVGSLAACDASPRGGFYFDDPAAPTKATLCPCSCAARLACSAITLLLFCGE